MTYQQQDEHCAKAIINHHGENEDAAQKITKKKNVHAQSLSLTLCDPMHCSLPSSSVPGISQARILKWAAISSSRESSWSESQSRVSCISCIGRHILYHQATWETPRRKIKPPKPEDREWDIPLSAGTVICSDTFVEETCPSRITLRIDIHLSVHSFKKHLLSTF